MQRLFPEALDYRTVTVKMTPERIAAVEGRLGAPLDESEKREFNFYDLTGRGPSGPRRIGTVVALAGKGEYGAIEVVVGLDPGGSIVGAYIQRSRERATKALQDPVFLGQFAGRRDPGALEVGRDLRPAAPEAETASRVVAAVVKKMLVFYDVLYPEGSRGETR